MLLTFFIVCFECRNVIFKFTQPTHNLPCRYAGKVHSALFSSVKKQNKVQEKKCNLHIEVCTAFLHIFLKNSNKFGSK